MFWGFLVSCLKKGIVMSRRCEITKKRFGKGRSYNTRGIAKKKKGIGLNITGHSKRRFGINLFTQKFWSTLEKRFIKLKLTAHAMRIIDKIGIDETLKRVRSKGLKL